MPQSLRVVLIGTGRWGQAYLQELAKDARFRVVAAGTRNPENLKALPYAVPAIAPWEQALQTPCDGAIIAAPPEAHGSLLARCVEKRIPILMEKPFCTSAAEADRLSRLVSEAGLPVLVDHIHLFNPAYRALKNALKAEGNRPVWIASEGVALGPFREHTNALWDWAPHDVALCLDLMDSIPIAVDAMTAPAPDGREEQFALRLDFEGGRRAWIHAGRLAPEKRRSLEVFTERCRYVWKDDSVTRRPTLTAEPFQIAERYARPAASAAAAIEPVSQRTPLQSVLDAFHELLTKGAHPLSGCELARNVTHVIAACEPILGISPQSFSLKEPL